MVTNVGAATPRAIISAKSTPDFSLKTEHNMAAEMSLTLTEEHEMIRQAARDFAQKEIAPVAAEYDVSGEFPFATIEKMGALGLMGIEVPEEYGGAGMDTVAYVLAMEEICKVDASHGTIMSTNNSLVCHGLLKYGTEAQKQRYLVPVASGEKIGAYSLTEPTSGSDAGSMRSRAVRSDEGYVINGRKSWVTSAPAADFVVLFTNTAPEKKHHGITAFLVETGRRGFSLGKTEPKLGVRVSATSEINFEDYHCPAENRLGNEGEGFKIAMTVLDAGRIGVAAQALGIAEAAYEASVSYCREREAFGKRIGEYQGLQFQIADMKTRIEAARLLIYNAVLTKERSEQNGSRYTLEASMAKLYA
ncbi:MAG: acyl-CoA dehydrogenase family protein, partial [Anaerolineales bacterium]|nr:acyl-CoA dehydrogenase family protein [Anaerolineales bacterium]